MCLTHVEFPVHEDVWHTQEAVAQGRDAVVEAAIDWIRSIVPVSQATLTATCTAEGIRLSWQLPESHAVAELAILREAANGRLQRLQIATTEPFTQMGEMLDAECEVGEQYLYQLEATIAAEPGEPSRILSNKVSIRFLGPEAAIQESHLISLHPNPANPFARIRFRLAKHGHGRLHIVDLMGRRVRSYSLQEYPAGEHEIQWDGTDTRGAPVASGVYQVLLETEATLDKQHITLLK
jgi:hypothetical protein